VLCEISVVDRTPGYIWHTPAVLVGHTHLLGGSDCANALAGRAFLVGVHHIIASGNIQKDAGFLANALHHGRALLSKRILEGH
jgi:hypothetical protein